MLIGHLGDGRQHRFSSDAPPDQALAAAANDLLLQVAQEEVPEKVKETARVGFLEANGGSSDMLGSAHKISVPVQAKVAKTAEVSGASGKAKFLILSDECYRLFNMLDGEEEAGGDSQRREIEAAIAASAAAITQQEGEKEGDVHAVEEGRNGECSTVIDAAEEEVLDCPEVDSEVYKCFVSVMHTVGKLLWPWTVHEELDSKKFAAKKAQ